MSDDASELKVLFVCLGNICRSPLAEGIFRKLLIDRHLDNRVKVQSCGTGGWHQGQPAHSQTVRTAMESGIVLTEHRARQLEEDDFDRFDLLVAMDRSNYRDIQLIRSPSKGQLVHLRSFDPVDPSDLDVPDPFYGGASGFIRTQEIIFRCCEALLDEVVKRL